MKTSLAKRSVYNNSLFAPWLYHRPSKQTLALMFVAFCTLLFGCEQSTSSSRDSVASPTVAPRQTSSPVLQALAGGVSSPTLNSSHGNDASYVLGNVVKFGNGGDGKRYQVSGWSGTEQAFTWTDATSAVLVFKIPPTQSALNLRMNLEGLTAPALPFQPVHVVANGKEIALWEVAEKRDFTAVIPADVSQGADTLTLTLIIPKATTPASLGMNNDTRTLGVHCFELQIAASLM